MMCTRWFDLGDPPSVLPPPGSRRQSYSVQRFCFIWFGLLVGFLLRQHSPRLLNFLVS